MLQMLPNSYFVYFQYLFIVETVRLGNCFVWPRDRLHLLLSVPMPTSVVSTSGKNSTHNEWNKSTANVQALRRACQCQPRRCPHLARVPHILSGANCRSI